MMGGGVPEPDAFLDELTKDMPAGMAQFMESLTKMSGDTTSSS